MRRAHLAVAFVIVAALGACTDLRDFHRTWQGARVGADPVLHVGADGATTATLTVDEVDQHGLAGHLTIAGLADAPLASLPGAEADALASTTFDGAPLRVYLAFVPTTDGGGDALAVIALYDERIELRVLRGGALPIYAIYALAGA
jgi:hypothetical protein